MQTDIYNIFEYFKITYFKWDLYSDMILGTNGDRKKVAVGENPEAFTHIVKRRCSKKGYIM